LKPSARFVAACIAERSAPLPRWKRLAGGFSRLTSPYICARKEGCYDDPASVRFTAHIARGPLGAPVQQPPRLRNASEIGVLARHPPASSSRVRWASGGLAVGAVTSESHGRRSPRAGRIAGAARPRLHGAFVGGAGDVTLRSIARQSLHRMPACQQCGGRRNAAPRWHRGREKQE
jgi:hypothetical protein